MLAMSAVDAELIPGLKARSEEAVAELLDRYWGRAYRVAYQLTGDPGAAEDVAQDTFVGVLRGVDKLKEGDPFRAWFFRILENTAKNYHRSRSRRSNHEQQASLRPEPHSVSPSTQVEHAEEAELVRRHLKGLSPKLRHALALRYLEGMSLEEVAHALQIPRKTVSSRIKRGIDSLRESLQPALQLSAAVVPEWLRRAMEVPTPFAPTTGAILVEPPTAQPPARELTAAETGRRSPGVIASLCVAFVALVGGGLLLGGALDVDPQGDRATDHGERRGGNGDTPETRKEFQVATAADSPEGGSEDSGNKAQSRAEESRDGGRLQPPGRVTLQALDEYGAPYADYRIRVIAKPKESGRQEAREGTTNAQGRFDFELPQGEYDVTGTVSKSLDPRGPHVVWLTVQDELTRFKLVTSDSLVVEGSPVEARLRTPVLFQRTGVLEIRVVDRAGNPVEGAALELIEDPGTWSRDRSIGRALPADELHTRPRTSGNGTHRLRRVPLLGYMVLARKGELGGRSQGVTLSRPGQVLQVEVALVETVREATPAQEPELGTVTEGTPTARPKRPTSRVEGMVFNASGQPVPGASVVCTTSKGGAWGTRTDASGKFSIAAEGQVVLSVEHSSYARSRLVVEIPPTGLSSLQITLSTGTRVTGNVKGDLTAVELVVGKHARLELTVEAFPREDGSFDLGQLAPGRWAFSTLLKNGERGDETLVDLTEAVEEEAIDLNVD